MKYDIEQIEFKNEKRFLSNMYPIKIIFDKIPESLNLSFIEPDFKEYNSSENLYQSLKSQSEEWHELIRSITPEKSKSLAKNKLKTLLANNSTTFLIREDWHKIKVDVMRLCIYLKFNQNKELKEKLISTIGIIEERNCWGDTFWGTVNGFGENKLGELLMELRENFIKEQYARSF